MAPPVLPTVFDVVSGPFLIRFTASEAGEDLWEKDPVLYLATFYQQFCNIILMATFAGGVQAAILAFMNDLLSNDTIGADLFKQDPTTSQRSRYTAYSLGLMLGLLAVALNIGVAAISAVNAALTCHFSIDRPKRKPSMEARVLFGMLVMFAAFCLSGFSLILLSIKFDLPFTIALAVLFFAGIVIAAYQLVALFVMKWLEALLNRQLHFFSVIAATAAFAIDISRPVASSWYTISAYGFTMLYHIVAVLYDKSGAETERPRRIAALSVTILAMAWVGCVVVTTAWHTLYTASDRPLRYILAGVAGFEAVLLIAIAVKNWWEIVRDLRGTRGGTSAIDIEAGDPQAEQRTAEGTQAGDPSAAGATATAKT